LVIPTASVQVQVLLVQRKKCSPQHHIIMHQIEGVVGGKGRGVSFYGLSFTMQGGLREV
jgi:hypothetical protein